MSVVDAEQFIKVLIDWIIDTDISRSDNPEQAFDFFPNHEDTGDIYFYNPMRNPATELVTPYDEEVSEEEQERRDK